MTLMKMIFQVNVTYLMDTGWALSVLKILNISGNP